MTEFHRRQFLQAGSAAAASLALPALAQAQNFPNRPIKLICPWPASGSSDMVMRALADSATKVLGQQVIVENKPGASGMLGPNELVKAAPDGYTLLVGSVSNLALNPGLYRNLPYDSLRDFEPVGLAVAYSYTLVARKDLPFANLRDLIAYAKANPGKLSYASGGSGSGQHVLAAALWNLVGANIVHVPYRGAQAAYQDLIGGQVTLMFGNWPEFRQHVQSGKLIALGMATAKRSPLAPQIATLAEQGLPIESNSWNGILTRSGTPDAVVQRLNAEINKALQAPAVVQAFQDGGIVSLAGSSDQFAGLVRSEIDKYAQVIRKAGITAES